MPVLAASVPKLLAGSVDSLMPKCRIEQPQSLLQILHRLAHILKLHRGQGVPARSDVKSKECD